MKKSSKTLLAISLVFVLMLSLIQVPKQVEAAETLDINADAAIIIEASTGKILYAKNEEAALGIASMTKMMTEYLMFEAIRDKKISWDQKHVISDTVHQVSVDTALSNVPLEKGAEYTIRELYEAMAIYSANGATMAIAEAIAGSEGAFVKMMNEKAEELGLKEYKFVNSSGLNNASLKGNHPEGTDANAENVMSAKSTAKLAMLIMKEFPEVLDTASIPRKKFKNLDGEMKNWNLMLPSLEFEYPGVDGLKTGTTDFAGRSFTGTAKRGDFRVITVVMNAKDSNGNSNDTGRFGETRKMFDYAFEHFSMKEVFPAKYEIKELKSLEVVKGKEKSVKVTTDQPIKVVVKNGEGNYTLEIKGNQTDANKHILYFLDSGDYSPENLGHYEWIHPDQVNWFREETKKNPELPGIALFHIPLPEFKEAIEKGQMTGNKFEPICSPVVNSGMFTAMLEAENIMGAFVGHDHDNDFIAELHGIALSYGRITGYNVYGRFERGARVIQLFEDEKKFATWIRQTDGEIVGKYTHNHESVMK